MPLNAAVTGWTGCGLGNFACLSCIASLPYELFWGNVFDILITGIHTFVDTFFRARSEYCVGNGQAQFRKPMSKQEEIMRLEIDSKRRLAHRVAEQNSTEKAAQAKQNGRKDAPWLQIHIVVKVDIYFYVFPHWFISFPTIRHSIVYAEQRWNC